MFKSEKRWLSWWLENPRSVLLIECWWFVMDFLTDFDNYFKCLKMRGKKHVCWLNAHFSWLTIWDPFSKPASFWCFVPRARASSFATTSRGNTEAACHFKIAFIDGDGNSPVVMTRNMMGISRWYFMGWFSQSMKKLNLIEAWNMIDQRGHWQNDVESQGFPDRKRFTIAGCSISFHIYVLWVPPKNCLFWYPSQRLSITACAIFVVSV